MPYDLKCARCSYNYYTVSNSQWRTSGTITVYAGYCGKCAGGTSHSWTWSGNVVKVECRTCSSYIRVISWSTWRNYSSGHYGYCSGCYDEYKREVQRKKDEADRIAREQRKEAAKYKSNYCPPWYSFSAPNWARVEKQIDGWNYVWNHCKIYCQENHCVYYQDKFDSSKSAGYYHQEITNILSMQQCPKCKQEEDQKAADKKLRDDALQKSNDCIVESGKIMAKLQRFAETNDCNEDNTNCKVSDTVNMEELSEIEKELNSFMVEAESQYATLGDLIKECQDMTDGVDKEQIIESEQKLEQIVKGIRNKQEKILNAKKAARDRIKVTNDKLIDLKMKEKANNDAFIKKKKKENEFNDINKEIESLQNGTKLSGKERNANPEAAQIIDKKYDNLLKNLKEKYDLNKQKSDDLIKCQDYITKIRAKLIATQSKNKYVLECLDQEYNRLNDVAQGAMVKFGQFPMYFLTMELNLKQDIIETFKEEGLDQDMESILELTDDDLIELNVKKSFQRKKILRKIKEFKDKQHIKQC